MGFDENVIFCKLRPKLYQSQFSMSKTKLKKSLKKINLGHSGLELWFREKKVPGI